MLSDLSKKSELLAKLCEELDRRRDSYTQILLGKIEQSRLEEKKKQDLIELDSLNREREAKRLKEIEDMKMVEEERKRIEQEQLLNQQRLAQKQRELDILNWQLQNARKDDDDNCVIA